MVEEGAETAAEKLLREKEQLKVRKQRQLKTKINKEINK